jgi:hypothetical protein
MCDSSKITAIGHAANLQKICSGKDRTATSPKPQKFRILLLEVGQAIREGNACVRGIPFPIIAP